MLNYALDSNDLHTQTVAMHPPTATAGPGLETLNTASQAEFVHWLGGVTEHAPWVAAGAWHERPFLDMAALYEAMVEVIRQAPADQQMALLNGHPELAGREAQTGSMTTESTGEQARLGLLNLAPADLHRLQASNLAYRTRFGYPLIIALRLHDSLDSIWADVNQRMANTPEVELAVALDQIFQVMRGRLERVLQLPGLNR